VRVTTIGIDSSVGVRVPASPDGTGHRRSTSKTVRDANECQDG
jgi:hypothetical protein